MNPDPKSPSQRERIAALCGRLKLQPPPADCDLDEFEALLRYLTVIDGEPTATYAHLLIADGIELPPPEQLDGQALRSKLDEVIRGLAHRRTYLESTDHLSDAELYRHLWEETLNESTYELDDSMGPCACHLDLLGNGSDESIRLHLQYYADDIERDEWRAAYPDEELPVSMKPPHDRDGHLPKPPNPWDNPDG